MRLKKIVLNVRMSLLCIFIASALVLVSSLPASAAFSLIQGWDLVDSGKHLDYDGTSVYMSSVQAAAITWNLYKPGVIRPDSGTVVEDCFFIDVNLSSVDYVGKTFPNGRIEMNKYYLSDLNSTCRLNTALHEMGHALGLEHHDTRGNVMYKKVSETVDLSVNDKYSYDSAYARY